MSADSCASSGGNLGTEQWGIYTPFDVPLSAKYKGSFGYITVMERIPVILTKLIDQLCRDKLKFAETYGNGVGVDIKEIVGRLSQFKSDVMTNKSLVPLTVSTPDAQVWHDYFTEKEEELGQENMVWFAAPWLFIECYMYRRIREAFQLSTMLREYDYFSDQKQEAYMSSSKAMSQLAKHVEEVRTKKFTYEYFWQFLQIDLWGNRCDLSLTAGSDASQKEDVVSSLDNLYSCVLNDHTHTVWDVLQKQNQNIGFVMDNAGFELFSDLCFADMLVSSGLAKNVKFYAKTVPWFISDVMVHDFYWTLEKTCEMLPFLGERWCSYVKDGTWSVEGHDFWTYPHDFSQMSKISPDLYKCLSGKDLLIFKGDLNYRKLVGDIGWHPTTGFHKALRGFLPTNLVALRTIKSDTVTGLEPGKWEVVAEKEQDWMVSGKFGIIQMALRES